MQKILYITTILVIILTFNGFGQSEKYLKNRITVEGTYLRNLGNYGKIWSNAVGAYIGYGIAFPDHILFIFRSGFLRNSLNDNVNFDDASSKIIPLEIGGRYSFIDNRFMPFFQFMNGFNIIFENTNLEGIKGDKTHLRYAWQIGFGVTINLTNNLNVDVGVNYQSDFYTKEAMNTGFEYAVGIGYAVGD